MLTGNKLIIIILDKGKLLSGEIASRPNTVIYAAEMGTIVLMNAGTTVETKGWPLEGQDR